jgi:hypothetical protein
MILVGGDRISDLQTDKPLLKFKLLSDNIGRFRQVAKCLSIFFQFSNRSRRNPNVRITRSS